MAETEHLRFAPEILIRLGEELVPHADIGIVELVRNAYDADATQCTVSLTEVDEPGGTVTILDNGEGMEIEQVRSGFLLLGRSSKTATRYSIGGRRKVGEKGLGRLAALRLGHTAELVTRPSSSSPEAGQEHSLYIDWNAFNDVESVEEVPLSILTRPASLISSNGGTCISVNNLRDRLTNADVKRLARALVLLTGPFPSENTFKVRLDAPEFKAMEELVRNSYFKEHEYLLTAEVDSDGKASAQLRDWRGTLLAEASHADLMHRVGEPVDPDSHYEAPRARFELYMFNLSKAGFDVRDSLEAYTAVGDWLRAVGGVHVFHRGLRVYPYGDPGHDWLDMNLRRARSPELRPSTNNSIGRMIVEDESDVLIPKTDRSGFLENDAFAELRRFGADVLEWAARERQRIREDQRQTDRDDARDKSVEATELVESTLSRLEIPPQVRPKIESALRQYQESVGRQLRSVEDDLLLYRTLSTVGTTMAVFAHETLRPVAAIETMAQSIDLRLRRDLNDLYESNYERPVLRILRAATSLRTFAEVPLRMLSRSKRRRESVDVNRVVAEILELFGSYFENTGIAVKSELTSEAAHVQGAIASLEAITANLVSNAVHFAGEGESESGRLVIVRTEVHRRRVLLTVLDTGQGIQGLEVDEVWLPGRTTREEGTGLGLTIVRDAVKDMGGRVHASRNGELGGAQFQVELPWVEQPSPSEVAASYEGGKLSS